MKRGLKFQSLSDYNEIGETLHSMSDGNGEGYRVKMTRGDILFLRARIDDIEEKFSKAKDRDRK